MPNQDQHQHQDDDKPLGFFELLVSALAALIGVSSQAKRERDFKKMKPHHFIISGIMLMILFFSIVMMITRTLLATH